MDVSKVLTELRKTRQSLVEAIVSVQRLAGAREAQRWVIAATENTAARTEAAKGE